MLKRYTAILLTVVISLASGVVVGAQGPQETFDQAAIDKIKEEGMKRSQVMDILVFNRWRRQAWWKAPLIGSLVATVVDTAVFFFLAFAGTQMDWLRLTAGDLAVKSAMAVLLLAPYRALLPHLTTWAPAAPAR